MEHHHRVQQGILSAKKVRTTMMIYKTKEDVELEPPILILDRKNNLGISTIKFKELQGMISTDQIR